MEAYTMIDTFSEKLTSAIKANVKGVSEEKAEIINYGINLLIYDIVVFTLVFSASLLLGIFNYVLASVAVIAMLRLYAGGAHTRSRLQCFFVYILTIFGIVYLAKSVQLPSLWVSTPVFLLGLGLLWLYAPGDTEEKPILSKKLIKRQRIVSFAALLLVWAASLVFWRFDLIVHTVIVLSVIPVLFLLSPLGYRACKCKRGEAAVHNTYNDSSIIQVTEEVK